MKEQVQEYKRKLEKLKEVKSKTEYEIQAEIEKSKQFKVQLQEMGFASLAEAKEFFVKEMGSLSKKSQQLDALIEELSKLEFIRPTNEEIFGNLNDVSENADSSEVNVKEEKEINNIENELFSSLDNIL